MSQLSRTLDPMNIGLSEPARKTQLNNVKIFSHALRYQINVYPTTFLL